MTRKWSKPSC